MITRLFGLSKRVRALENQNQTLRELVDAHRKASETANELIASLHGVADSLREQVRIHEQMRVLDEWKLRRDAEYIETLLEERRALRADHTAMMRMWMDETKARDVVSGGEA